LGGSQAKSSGAVNQQQATGQSQARRCRVEQAAGQVASRGDARAGKRVRTGGAKKKSPPRRPPDFQTPLRKGVCVFFRGISFLDLFDSPPFYKISGNRDR
jgi:hypothetical protein